MPCLNRTYVGRRDAWIVNSIRAHGRPNCFPDSSSCYPSLYRLNPALCTPPRWSAPLCVLAVIQSLCLSAVLSQASWLYGRERERARESERERERVRERDSHLACTHFDACMRIFIHVSDVCKQTRRRQRRKPRRDCPSLSTSCHALPRALPGVKMKYCWGLIYPCFQLGLGSRTH